ncbi:hypothetical protein HOLleu_37288 [Holothuria leucospilota]|uniref:Uncharacterized protein n=1 Tax=Holothuria leucospilota TaxID=206669 RepID=A0A9Q0YGW9_HOLLE|nr:hypothetical protein HOLleu_37288 [Holothuria leucospilota]
MFSMLKTALFGELVSSFGPFARGGVWEDVLHGAEGICPKIPQLTKNHDMNNTPKSDGFPLDQKLKAVPLHALL